MYKNISLDIYEYSKTKSNIIVAMIVRSASTYIPKLKAHIYSKTKNTPMYGVCIYFWN